MGLGYFFVYQYVHIGMGFVDLVWILVFAGVLIGLGSNLKKIQLWFCFFGSQLAWVLMIFISAKNYDSCVLPF